MMQDLTAPDYQTKASRLEQYEESFHLVESDEDTPWDVSAYSIVVELFEKTGKKRLGLTLGAGITRPAAHLIVVQISTEQMKGLAAGEYILRLFGILDGERSEFVTNYLQLV